MARGRNRRGRVWGAVVALTLLVAGICVLYSLQEKYGHDFGLPRLNIPSISQVFGEIEDISREPAAENTALAGLGDTLIVHQLDMGQADSVLIQGPDKVVLIDAGENGQGERILRYLRDEGIEAVDLLIGTHPHSDHIGGMDTVILGIEIREVIMPEIPEALVPATVTYTDVLTAILDKDIPFTPASPGDRYELGGGASLTILGPLRDYNDLNNQSVTARVVFGATSFLFTGDMEREAEADLIESGVMLRSDVLSVGHHGSNTSSSREFLDAVAPQVAVISCGQDNSYSHPHREVMERLRDMSVTILRTDRDGTVRFVSDGKTIGMEVET